MAEILHFEFFCENTDKQTHTNTQTNTQTDMGITIPRPPPMGGEVTIYKHVTELIFDSIHGTLPAQRDLTITLTPAYTYILTTTDVLGMFCRVVYGLQNSPLAGSMCFISLVSS